jgi:hypothetical protein
MLEPSRRQLTNYARPKVPSFHHLLFKEIAMKFLSSLGLRFRSNRQVKKRARRPRPRAQLGIEPLEDRRLMSFNPVVPLVPNAGGAGLGAQFAPVAVAGQPHTTLQGGALVIQGSSLGDAAIVDYFQGKVRVSFTYTSPPHYSQDLGMNMPGLTIHDPDQFFDPAQVTRIYFFGGAGDDFFTNTTAIPCTASGTGSDNFVGGAGDDLLTGGAGPNVIEGGGGTDTFVAGSGDNRFMVSSTDLGSLTINGQANGYHNVLDFSQFGPSGITLDLGKTAKQTVHTQKLVPDLSLQLVKAGVIQEVWGSPFDDIITGGSGDNVIKGGAGIDKITGGFGNNTIDGGPGSDIITGGLGNNVIQGGSGDDTITGGPKDNTIDGGGGTDTFFAGHGNNRFVVTATDLGTITVSGPANGYYNILDFSNFGPSGVTVDLRTTGMQAVHSVNGLADLQLKLVDSGAIQEVKGSFYNDIIHAGDKSVIVHGDGGSDVIYGGQGVDFLYGDSGTATFITIGAGLHYAYGGSGKHNTFWVNTTDVTDYSAARDDIGHLHSVDSFFNYTYSYTATGVVGEYTVNSTEAPLNTLAPYPGNLYGGILPEPLNGPKNPDSMVYQDFSSNPLFSSAGPAPDDIQQGHGADCYLMSYLAAVAKTNPARIPQTIVDLGDGSYAVEFHQNDNAHTAVFVRVDGWLLTMANKNILADAGLGGQNSIWVPLIEKAWMFFRYVVKTDGFYATEVQTNKGSRYGLTYSDGGPELPAAFNTPVDGDPVSVTDSDNATDVLNAIALELAQNKAVCCAGPHPWWYNNAADHTAETDDPKYHHSSAHEYMVDHVDYLNGVPIDIVLRNPYGSDHTGSFPTNSPDGWVTIPADLFAYGCSNYIAYTV